MFKIFDRNHKQIDILENPYNAIITDELNGIGELKFTVPITYKKLQLEGYVQVKDGHEYVIKEITTEGRERNVHCVLNIEELLGMVHTTFTSKENNLNDTMKIILNGTTWTHVNNSTRTYTRNLYGTVVSSYHMLQLMSTVFDVEFYFDTHKKIVYIVDRVGEDNGTYFINDLNLKQLSQDTHTHNLITRVIPLGKDNLNISEVNGGKMWLENHTYSNKIIYGVWQVTDYDNATKLKEDAQRYLNEMAIPYESYEIQVTDISKLANNPDFKYELGDVITIIDNLTETRIKQRIYRKVYNLQDPDADIINIASKDKSFEDYYKRMQTVADMTDKVINTDGTINSEAIDKVPADKIVGDILATGIKADSITADHIKAEQIQSKHITADAISANHIKANSIQTKHLQANSVTSEHIQADTITTAHIQAGAITAGSGIIADGAIGNAQISNLDAGKLTAGTIDTSDITIAGANQNLRITGNRLQVFEGVGNKQKERVSLGDVNADGTVYGIRVRGKDGTTVLFDDNGVTKEGITDGSITNDKINPSANIDGSKLNINSVINKINSDGSTTIQGNRISIDNKSLSSVISEINTKNTAQDSTIASQASSITANTNAIKLKVDTQTYTTDKTNMTSKLDKATSEISTMKNQIALKVEQSHINNAVNSLNNTIDSKINSAKSEIKATTDSISSRVSKTETNITTVSNKIDNMQVGSANLFKGFPTTEPYELPVYQNVGSFKQFIGNFAFDPADYIGEQFTISFYAKSPNGVGTLRLYNQNGNPRYFYFSPVTLTNNLGDEWQYFTYTITNTDRGEAYSPNNKIEIYSDNQIGVQVKEIKIEKGNKATAWCPSFADVQSQIDSTVNLVNTTKSEILQTTDSITSRVEQVESRGGANLLLNSNFTATPDKTANWSVWNGQFYTDQTWYFSHGEGIGVYTHAREACTITSNEVKVAEGDTFTFSCKIAVEVNCEKASICVREFYEGGGYYDTFTDVESGYVGDFERTFTITDPRVRHIRILIWNYCKGETTYTVTFVNRLKLERGSIKTEWSPCTNDVLHEKFTEIKQTTDGITSTVSNLQQGQSTLTQRVDGFEFNVQNSSSSNLLYDSGFNKGTTYWWPHEYFPNGWISTEVNIAERWSNPDWIPHNTNVIQVRCTDNWYQSNFERGMLSVWIPVLPHKTYTLTFYHACHRGIPYVTIRNAHNSVWITHRGLPAKSGGYLLNDNWGYETLTFNVGETDNIRVEFGIKENYGDAWAWFCKPMLVEGSVGQKHSPHAGEVYNGVTIIDSQGVRVTHENGDFSQMTASGFKRHRTDGALKGDYHYLMQNGTIYCNSEQYVRIYLPEDFHWKKLNAVACASCIGTGSDAHEKPEPLISFWAEVNAIASDSSWVEFYASTRQNRNGSVLTSHKGIKFAYWITA